MIVDDKFEKYFNNNLKQVFFYITNNCQLHCKQCLYKPELKKGNDMNYDMAICLLKTFKNYGAIKLTLIGGEPTSYDIDNENENLFRLITEAKDIGYEYIRIDTNGQFDANLLENKCMQMIDEITFSLDGYDSKTNDIVRGSGSFNKCISNLKNAVRLGYNVQITTCVHSSNIFVGNTESYIEKMTKFAEKQGARAINFHPILKVGVPRDNWIEETDISIQEWIYIYNKYKQNYINTSKIKVRVPQRFVEIEEYKSKKTFYDYCPVDLAERVLVHPNGDIRICAFWIGSNITVAKYLNEKIVWENENNEIDVHKRDKCNACSTQRIDDNTIIPLCMSFKPKQTELIWNLIHCDKR